MVKESIIGRMEGLMKGSIKTTKSMVLEFTSGQMVEGTKEAGKTGSSMGRVHIINLVRRQK